jgi:hypothetical protein
MELARE